MHHSKTLMLSLHGTILIAVLLFGAVACNRNPTEQPAHLSNRHAATALDTAHDTTAEIRQYTGALVIGHEAEYFVDCSTKATWWLDYEATPDLPMQYQQIITRPYQEVYAQVEGYLAPPMGDGFEEQYEQVLRVVRVLAIDHLDGGNDCTPQQQ